MIKLSLTSSLLFIGVLAGSLLFSACSITSSGVLTTLTTVVDAAAAVVGIVTAVQSGGAISTGNVDTILQYAEAASTAASEAITEWQSSDTTEQKLTVIAGDFASIATPALGSVTSTEVQALIQTLSRAIEAIVAQVHSGAAAAHTATLSHKSLALSPVGHLKLRSLKSRADATVVKAELFRAHLRAASK